MDHFFQIFFFSERKFRRWRWRSKEQTGVQTCDLWDAKSFITSLSQSFGVTSFKWFFFLTNSFKLFFWYILSNSLNMQKVNKKKVLLIKSWCCHKFNITSTKFSSIPPLLLQVLSKCYKSHKTSGLGFINIYCMIFLI